MSDGGQAEHPIVRRLSRALHHLAKLRDVAGPRSPEEVQRQTDPEALGIREVSSEDQDVIWPRPERRERQDRESSR